ncbi:hypothetical protein [Sphingomonas segetis]|uniref:hypothetical protein n=1 Tax=Sphingomonas segetis TaxID=1104779 RepID=UPI0012D33093|nr:hypothetical protein [Sphingomonas segetis]
MFENLVEDRERRQTVRRVPALEDDRQRDIDLLQRAVAASVKEDLGWDGEIDFSPKEVDREALERKKVELGRLLNTPVQHTFDYNLWPGWQVIVPKYEYWWAVGTGMPWAHLDGHITVFATDGFSASGFGFYLEADEEGYASIFPSGPGKSSWAAFKDAPRLRSKAGAGAVVYEGSSLLVSRQPVMWDVQGPKQFTGGGDNRAFGNIASPTFPGMFGPVPLAPVLAPIGPGRRLLVWFYHWHLGENMKDAAFLSFVASEVPMVFVNFGKGPIVN